MGTAGTTALMDDVEKEIGARIRQARREAGFTQPQLAEIVGVELRTVQGYEANEIDPYRKLRQLAEALGVTIGWLLHGERDVSAAVGEKFEEIRQRLETLEALVRERLDGPGGS